MLDLSVALINLDHLDKTKTCLNVIITNYDELSFSKGIQLYYLISQYIRGLSKYLLPIKPSVFTITDMVALNQSRLAVSCTDAI